MSYPENYETARKFASSAQEEMEGYSIPPNPMNFTVWYTYVTGQDQALNAAIDKAIGQKQGFTAELNEEIYGNFFSLDKQGRAIEETGGQIEKTVEEMLAAIATATDDTAGYGKTLTDLSQKLVSDRSDAGKIIQRILSETHSIVQKNRTLEKSLQSSSEEITALRDHLKSMRDETLTDALTGIPNRKCFDLRLSESLRSAKEDQLELCLVMIDIDHFKKFNDTYGHRIGDSVLKVVARNLKDGVKGKDTPARYGGEEFAIILPDTSLAGAQAVAEKIREQMARKQLKNTKTGEKYGTITLSMGVAKFRSNENSGSLIQRADEALYRAKHDGRNRVVPETLLEKKVRAAV